MFVFRTCKKTTFVQKKEKAKQVKAKLSKYTSSRVWYYNPETMKQIYVVEGTQPDNYVAGRLTYKRMVKGDK